MSASGSAGKAPAAGAVAMSFLVTRVPHVRRGWLALNNHPSTSPRFEEPTGGGGSNDDAAGGLRSSEGRRVTRARARAGVPRERSDRASLARPRRDSGTRRLGPPGNSRSQRPAHRSGGILPLVRCHRCLRRRGRGGKAPGPRVPRRTPRQRQVTGARKSGRSGVAYEAAFSSASAVGAVRVRRKSAAFLRRARGSDHEPAVALQDQDPGPEVSGGVFQGGGQDAGLVPEEHVGHLGHELFLGVVVRCEADALHDAAPGEPAFSSACVDASVW